jgi:hypothetical protein
MGYGDVGMQTYCGWDIRAANGLLPLSAFLISEQIVYVLFFNK